MSARVAGAAWSLPEPIVSRKTCCTELVAGVGHVGLGNQPNVDGQGFAVPVLRLIQPPPVHGNPAEHVRGDREMPLLH